MISFLDSVTWGFARILRGLLQPLDSIHPLCGLAVVSVLFGAIVVLVYRFLSSQSSIQSIREHLGGDLLGLVIYSHSLRQIARSFRQLLTSLAWYLLASTPPLFVLALLLLLSWPGLEAGYGKRSLLPGEECLITARFRESDVAAGAELKIPPDDQILAGPISFDQGRAAVWRIRVGSATVHPIEVLLPGARIAPSTNLRVHPYLGTLPVHTSREEHSRVISIECLYPSFRFWLAGREVHWIVPGIILLFCTSWILGRTFRVRF